MNRGTTNARPDESGHYKLPPMTAENRPQLTEHHQNDDIAGYRELCVTAVVGLVLGVLSATALVDPLMWFVPVVAAVVSAVALRRIARSESVLVGRKRAMAGLMLAVLFGVAAVTDYTVYRHLVRQQGQRFAEEWFALLMAGEPQKAYQYLMPPDERHPPDGDLWKFYRESDHYHRQLLAFAKRPEVRTLVALGSNALVRYYETDGQMSSGERDELFQAYAVTYDDAGKRKTFFIGLTLTRHHLDDGRAAWQIIDVHKDFTPYGSEGSRIQ